MGGRAPASLLPPHQLLLPPSLQLLSHNSSLPIVTMKVEESTVTEESDDLSSVKSDDQSSLKSDDSSGSSRLKFLYSYGGRILPRPGDGKLRYVGGETRVMAAARNITFADLMAKITEVLGSSLVLKCQLPTEDLDALISIKSDEDLENLLEEYDRLRATQGSSKVRAFLFPKPTPPLKPPAAAGHMSAMGGGHMVPLPVTRSALPDASPHGSETLFCLPLNPSRSSPPVQRPRGPQQHVREIVSKARRPPRSPAVHPDVQSDSPVRYATQIHDKITTPPQQNSAERAISTAYVDAGQLGHVGHASFTRLVYCNNNYYHQYTSPATQVPFSGKATKISPLHHRKTEAHYPFPGGVFQVHH